MDERYIKEKIVAKCYRASIEGEDLKVFIAAGWVGRSSIDELIKCQIIQCVEEECEKRVNEEELYLFAQAVKSMMVQIHTSEAEVQKCSLRREYTQPLVPARYGNIIKTELNIDIKQFLTKPSPFQLYHRMLDTMIWDNNQNFQRRL